MEVYKHLIKEPREMAQVIRNYIDYPPTAAAFDTEADSLHILDGRLFLFQFGWYNWEHRKMFVYAVDKDITPEYVDVIRAWQNTVKTSPVYLGHNVKYDLHMVANEECPYEEDNISDTYFYIRAAHDNISTRHGGVKLGLKPYTKKYIDASAGDGDKAVQADRARIAKKYNTELKQSLGWTLKRVDEFFKDKTNTDEDFPNVNDLIAYKKWKASLPKALQNIRGRVEAKDVPYNMVNRQILLDYGFDDIIYTLRIHIFTTPIIEQRGTMNTIEFENECIYPLWRMERRGLHVDTEYVTRSFTRMKKYIRQRRQDLIDLVGMPITAYQNAKFKDYLQHHGLPVTGTGDDVLARIPLDYPGHPTLPAIECLRELRTLEKWMTTYLFRMMGHDKLYTQLNQVGAASLRMSSDFQQFPKKGIKDMYGNELFNPRRAIIPPPGEVFVYIDYSQIELRFQAIYTIALGEPDLNLCRAFMPYKCHTATGIDFDYNNYEHLTTWQQYIWYHHEDGVKWEPVDVHGATTKAAFNIDETHPKYKDLRSMGKRVNFAKNYGATKTQIRIMFPDISEEEVRAIDGGYYKAFPSVLKYHQYCEQLALSQPYATNLFGLRYWGVNGHTLKNMLVQGSAAIFLKKKINEIDAEYKDHPTINLVLPVHDEIQFSMREEDLVEVPHIQSVMSTWEDTLVTITADIEISRTNWAEKEEVEM